MVLGPTAPPPSVTEVVTGSPFGLQLLAGRLPLFDPYGWTLTGVSMTQRPWSAGHPIVRELMTKLRRWQCCKTRSRPARFWPGQRKWACFAISPK